ncbi:capsid protein [Alcea yellow mosaic virus]|nr:capsid protein [Alcea yellow mosaic virus]
MDSDLLISHQPAFNTKADSLPLQPGQTPPTISQPFQILVASLGLKDLSDAISIASNARIAPFTNSYRHACLTSLQVSLHPTGAAPSFPTTVSLVWVPNNSTATPEQILSVYGAKQFCIGGAVNSVTPLTIPCNLTNVNPVIKSSTTFLDTPKLLLSSTAPPTPPTVTTCSVTISGVIQLHSPLLQSSAS